VFCRELEAQRADGFNDNDLELVADFRHEASDLLDQPIDGGFVTGLPEKN
jgi:hypothetical protein